MEIRGNTFRPLLGSHRVLESGDNVLLVQLACTLQGRRGIFNPSPFEILSFKSRLLFNCDERGLSELVFWIRG